MLSRRSRAWSNIKGLLAEPTTDNLTDFYYKVVWDLSKSPRTFPIATAGWGIVAANESSVMLRKKRTRLVLDRYHADVLRHEARLWKRLYLPSFPLAGKTVLDVGAGTGETASFFFEHGAKKVVAIESDQKVRSYLSANSLRNGWDIDIRIEQFKPEHLRIPHDFVKIDCEGGEELLLDQSVRELKPCRIEFHPSMIGKEKCIRIARKFDLGLMTMKAAGVTYGWKDVESVAVGS